MEQPDLDTIAGARAWLTDPNNWHESQLFILKWQGLTPTVMARHGQRLIDEPWDDGLPWAVVYERHLRRRKAEAGESVEEQPAPSMEEE